MQINYTGAAFTALCDVINYVESTNTLGAGVRWLNKLEKFLLQSLQNPSVIRFCNNHTFYRLELRCLNFNDWVIAFSIDANSNVLIEAVLHSSRIVD
jgi:hypothetical protein